ncbi:Pseudouridine synthase I [Trypanosoma melophagium]|uniref:Pseudouridine synthase I n=1 Tax=Trypanosoma melophagium TaxID=715481 RepID=UPI00351A701B|nr:Pseudouridine synthase I [Trypanosoma melophagium]
MWTLNGCSRLRSLSLTTPLVRVVSLRGNTHHHHHHLLYMHSIPITSSFRFFRNNSKDGGIDDYGNNNNNNNNNNNDDYYYGEKNKKKENIFEVEHVEGESISVDNASHRHRWFNNDEEAKQQRAVNDAITRLFQDDRKRQLLREKPGRTIGAQTTTTVITTVPEEGGDKEEEDEDFGNKLYMLQTGDEATTTTCLASVETVEQELLDDAFLYFPPAGDVDGNAITDPAGEPYVPGQQIIPPGSTRYRVDVQYQGNDFDGWWKSTKRQSYRREMAPDGSIRQVPLHVTHTSEGENPANSSFSGETMSSRYHARTVLEEALAVALDVDSVKVVASVIPEVGVSVRRLSCHVDVPSHITLQPRTIIQRATMWLEKRQQPLAILSCQRCKNQDFHARHSGLRRVYVYRILNRVAPPLFDAGLQWHVDRYLDVNRMQRFAKALQGTMDYGYFADPKMANALRRAAVSSGGLATGAAVSEHYRPTATGESPRETRGKAPKVLFEKGPSNLDRAGALPTFNKYGQRVVQPGAHPREYYRAATNLPTIRTIDRLDVVRQEDEVLIWFIGQSFLRHQIRNMVSVLKAAGHGLWDELELQQAIQSGFEPSRRRFKRERLPPAPVYGLTLWDVEYPEQHRGDYVPFVDSGPFEEVNIARDI